MRCEMCNTLMKKRVLDTVVTRSLMAEDYMRSEQAYFDREYVYEYDKCADSNKRLHVCPKCAFAVHGSDKVYDKRVLNGKEMKK